MTVLTNDSRCDLNRFKRQYQQLQANIRYPTPENLRQEAFQQALFDEIFDVDAINHHPPERYQLRILKQLMRIIESSIEDWDREGISDDLMSRLSVLVCSPIPSEEVSAQQKTYVTYTLSSIVSDDALVSAPTITLLEARNLIAAGGTTGLRTWEACLHLGNYLCSSGCTISLAGKSILELGAGTGYLSILCAKYLGVTHATVSDGADTVVSDLPTSFYLNGLENNKSIAAKELSWGCPLIGGEQPEWNDGRSIDVVLGADVTYHKESIPALVATLVEVVGLFPHVQIVIAAAIRNEDTFGSFLAACAENSFAVEDLNFPVIKPMEQNGPFYSDTTPIRLCKISKN